MAHNEARLIRNGSDRSLREICSRQERAPPDNMQDRVKDLSAELPERIEVRHERT